MLILDQIIKNLLSRTITGSSKKEIALDSVETYPLSPKIPHPGRFLSDPVVFLELSVIVYLRLRT